MPRPPREQHNPGSYAENLQASIQALSASGQENIADPMPEEPEISPMPEAEAGLDYSADGGDEPEAAEGEWGRSSEASTPVAPSPPPPPLLPEALEPDEVARRVIDALKAQGVPVDDGVIQGAIANQAANARAGLLPGATVESMIGTAVRLNMRHQHASAVSASSEATTRATVMAEPKVPWRHERSFKVIINGWAMRVPANRTVMLPLSVHEVCQNAVAQEIAVKAMQNEMYHRMTGIPQPIEDPNLYEGYDDHSMRIVQ